MLLLFVVTGYFLFSVNEHMGRAVRVISILKSESLEGVTSEQMFEGAIKGIVGSLEDPYSVYMDPREYEQLETNMGGSYGGVGIWVGMQEGNRLTVISPIKGSPAYEKGLEPGDVIVRIGDLDTSSMDMDTAVEHMKGEPGTEVVLGIQRSEQRELLEVAITREIINIPSVEAEIMEDHPNIAYIDMIMFSHTTAGDLAGLLAELEQTGYEGIVLDLRDNPGGSLEAAIEVSDFFVPEGPIVHIVSSRENVQIDATGSRIDKPLVVLVNGGSASASEIVAGAIRDSGAGTVVGTKTFGKGLIQTVYELDGGTAVKLTTAKYLTPDKHDIDKKGIEPQHKVEADPEAGKDVQLEKAIEILNEKIK